MSDKRNKYKYISDQHTRPTLLRSASNNGWSVIRNDAQQTGMKAKAEVIGTTFSAASSLCSAPSTEWSLTRDVSTTITLPLHHSNVIKLTGDCNDTHTVGNWRQCPAYFTRSHNVNLGQLLLTGWWRGEVVNALVVINEVTLRRARLLLGWVTTCRRVNHLDM